MHHLQKHRQSHLHLCLSVLQLCLHSPVNESILTLLHKVHEKYLRGEFFLFTKLKKKKREVTLEQPGVNAPGTANSITVFPLHNSDRLTLLAGVFSNKSTLGTLSPT